MFNCDKVNNNEVQGYLFFSPIVMFGGHFFALIHKWIFLLAKVPDRIGRIGIHVFPVVLSPSIELPFA